MRRPLHSVSLPDNGAMSRAATGSSRCSYIEAGALYPLPLQLITDGICIHPCVPCVRLL